MSVLSRHGRITVKSFASVPSLDSLPAIHRALPSVSNVSSCHGIEDGIDLAEGCLVTRTIRYTHQLIHWVNSVQSYDPEPIGVIIEDLLQGVDGAEVLSVRLTNQRQNLPHAARPTKTIESESGEEVMEDEQDMQIPSGSHAVSSRRSLLRSLREMDLETRKAYGRAPMSGHDREYGPALFEDAFPINESHLYSEKITVEAWQQNVSSDPSETPL